MSGSERSISMPLGVVLKRRELDNRWQRWSWRPVAVIPGAPPIEDWRELEHGDGWRRWHAATLPLELHRKETEAYLVNLSGRRPVVWVVLRPGPPDAPAERELRPFRVTASAYEAQDHLDGDDIVEGVPMPEGLIAWVQAFVTRHHVEQPFIKRKRERHDPEGSARRADAPRHRHGRT